MPKVILFTFDYELFLGNKSGQVGECLIKPTNKLLSIFDKAGFKAIFFIDTVYLKRLNEIAEYYSDAKVDLDAINSQLKKIIAAGHYVFPHIHAHWLDAEYLPEKNEWSLTNNRYYRFSNIPTELQDELFTHSVEYVYSIMPKTKNNTIDSYRAGGWSIQPFDAFKKQFIKHYIQHDFSVIPGKYQYSDAHEFDFRDAPIGKTVYRFSEDVCIEQARGQFTEWTISSVEFTGFQKWIDFKINGILHRFHGKPNFNGSTIELTIIEEGDVLCSDGHTRIIASFEGLNIYRVKKYILAIKESDYFHFISHPKLLTDYDFKMIKKIFSSLNGVKGIETDFRKVLLND